MEEKRRAVLCVDDEEKILHSLQRLLRGEDYRVFTAQSGPEGLKVLEKNNNVNLVISDQRMPGMSGTEFLANVKEKYPDIIRIVLTGYTGVESITESINMGHIYKFIHKPWNDQNLMLEIRHGLEQYELLQANKILHERVMQQNKELIKFNEHLEMKVRERTKDLEIQNQALELSRTILEGLPIPVVGISEERTIVFTNNMVQTISADNGKIEIGRNSSDYFSTEVEKKISFALTTNSLETLKNYTIFDRTFDIDFMPLAGKFQGKGVIMMLI